MTVPCDNSLALDVLPSLRLAEHHGYYVPAAIIFGVGNVSPLVQRWQHIIVEDNIEVEFGALLQGVCLLVIVYEGLFDLLVREVEEFYACVIHIVLLLPTFNFFGDECPYRECSLTLYCLSLLLFLLLLLRLLLHLCHLLVDELLVFIRVLLCHVVQLLPHLLHLLGVDARWQTTFHPPEYGC